MGYTDQQRQQALDLYVEHGAAEAARRCGADKRSIRRWAADAGLSAARDQNLEDGAARLALQHTRLREEIRLRMLTITAGVLDRIEEAHEQIVTLTGSTGEGAHVERVPLDLPTAGDVKSYATAAAILLDKYRLEMGESTGRTESHLTVDQLDDKIAQLEGQLAGNDPA